MDSAVGGTGGDHGLRGATATGSPDLSREDVTFPPHLIPDDDRSEVRGSSYEKSILDPILYKTPFMYTGKISFVSKCDERS